MMEVDMEDRARQLLKYLEKHREDRGMMADLRQGFSEATANRSWPYVANWCDLANDRWRIIYQTVMAAYAHHPQVAEKANIGHVLRRIAMGDGRGQEGLSTFDGRFRRIITCDSAQEVCQQLRGVIRAAIQKSIRIDYVQLFTDLCYWGPRVKMRWASTYWGTAEEGGGG
jgi:CRISPR type I-E-associated protein CasB/Cse2